MNEGIQGAGSEFADGERIPDLSPFVSEARNQDRWRQQQNFRARRDIVGTDNDLFKIDPRELRQTYLVQQFTGQAYKRSSAPTESVAYERIQGI